MNIGVTISPIGWVNILGLVGGPTVTTSCASAVNQCINTLKTKIAAIKSDIAAGFPAADEFDKAIGKFGTECCNGFDSIVDGSIQPTNGTTNNGLQDDVINFNISPPNVDEPPLTE
ncbi:MAG: hypothetical protein HYR96_16035 [Deltaproteobacteria bacterium]|nr:hypothetical protein [Deltaproteobacteria bacterium]